MENEGFIFLHRKLMEWEWYDDANVMRLFIHCLLEANYADKEWRGITIKRGSFITSQPKLAHRLKLSVKQIRTALDKLKMTGEVAVYTTADYSVISIKNYDDYQYKGSLKDTQRADKGQAKGRLRATTNNNNKENKENNTHTDNVCAFLKNEEKEILVRYAKKSGAKNPQAYIHSLIKNGSYKEILESEKEAEQKRIEKHAQVLEQLQKYQLTEEERAEADAFRDQITERLKQTGRFI